MIMHKFIFLFYTYPESSDNIGAGGGDVKIKIKLADRSAITDRIQFMKVVQSPSFLNEKKR